MHPLWKALSGVPVTFANGQAQVVQVCQKQDILTALQTLGLSCRPTLVLIGGASRISPTDTDRLQHLFIEVLAPLAEELGAIVVDGGTNAGVMQLIGWARSSLSATFPLVGVSPRQLVHFSNRQLVHFSNQGHNQNHPCDQPDPTSLNVEPHLLHSGAATVALEPHHTHFILVPGAVWGDESSWLAWIASALAGSHPSIAVLVNGGRVSLVDVQWNIAEGRSIAVVAGSGRLADEIANGMRDPQSNMREPIATVVQSKSLQLIDLAAPIDDIATFLKNQMGAGRSSLPINT